MTDPLTKETLNTGGEHSVTDLNSDYDFFKVVFSPFIR